MSDNEALDVKNVYGGGPGTGITLPPYYKPTPNMKSRNNFFPLSEEHSLLEGLGGPAQQPLGRHEHAARRQGRNQHQADPAKNDAAPLK